MNTHNRNNDSSVLMDIRNDSLISEQLPETKVSNHNGSIIGDLLSRRKNS